MFKWCSIGTNGPKVCQENIPHIITPPDWTVETRQDGTMFSCSLRQILTLPAEPYLLPCRSRTRDSSDHATFFPIFYCPILRSLCELYPPFPVLSWQERHPVWCSAAVAHLLQGSTCCVFRDGILHTLVVTSGYLSYCFLSIISNQSAHSPLTSEINKAFSFTQLPCFLFFRPFSVNPSTFKAPTTVPCSKSLKSPFWFSVWTSASHLHHI